MGRGTTDLPAHRLLSASEIAMLFDFAIAGGFPVPGRRIPRLSKPKRWDKPCFSSPGSAAT